MHIDLCFSTVEVEGSTLSPDGLAEKIIDFKEALGQHLEGFEVKNAEEDDDALDVQSAILNIEALREELEGNTDLELTDYEVHLTKRYKEFLAMVPNKAIALATLHRVEGTEIFRVRDEFWASLG